MRDDDFISEIERDDKEWWEEFDARYSETFEPSKITTETQKRIVAAQDNWSYLLMTNDSSNF